MFSRKSVIATLGAAMVGLGLAVSVNAWGGNANRTTALTFSGPVALPGVTLTTGTYVFELADPMISVDIVRVMSKDRRNVYFMGYTRSIQRPAGMRRERQITLGEALPGESPRITAWYPTAEAGGHQFIYRDSAQ